MLLIKHAPGGLLISRWTGENPVPLEQLFVATDELAAVIAQLIQEAAELDDATAWDVEAWLRGNPMAVGAASHG